MSDFQITGVYSGIDWGDIIDEYMENGRAIEEQWEDEQDEIDGKVELYEELKDYLTDLQDSLDSLKLESTFLNKTADVSVQSGSDSILSVTATANAEIANYDIDILSVAQKDIIAGDSVEDADSELGLEGDFTLSVGDFDVTVSVSSEDSLNDIVSAINDAVEEQASEDEVDAPLSAKIMDNTLVISSTETGSDYAISVTDTDGVLQGLGVLDDDGNFSNQLKSARDAVIEIDGLKVTRSSNTIDDLIDGVTLDISGTGSASVEIDLDAEDAVNAVQTMVDAYNSVLEWINTRTTEDTVDEPETETEELQGLLKGDTLLYSTKNNMRRTISRSRSDSVDGDYKTVSSIGITTESSNYGESGELEFDEDTFMDAMISDPSNVMDLVNSLAEDMDDLIDGLISESTINVGSSTSSEGTLINRIDSLESSSSDIDERIEDLEDRLELEKATLEKKYAAMETNLAALSQQAEYISMLSDSYSSGSSYSSSSSDSDDD